jgi:TonB family protein
MRICYFLLFFILPFTSQSQDTKDSISIIKVSRGAKAEFNIHEFIKKNIKYPESARRAGEEADIYVLFAIDTNGYVCDVRTIKPKDSILAFEKEFEKEAIRVIKLMPKWIPAIQNGTLIKSRKKIEIKFKLKDEE